MEEKYQREEKYVDKSLFSQKTVEDPQTV